jgi:hypothetical protein
MEILNTLLNPFVDRKELASVPISKLIEIINLTDYDQIEGGNWDKEAIITCLKNMEEICNGRAYLAARIDRDIKRGARAMLSENDYEFYHPDGPTLMMYRYLGSNEKGWDDEPLWVPNLRFPDGNRFFMFSTIDIENTL